MKFIIIIYLFIVIEIDHMCHVQNWLMWVKVGYIIENRIFSIIYYILLNKFKIIIHIKCIALYIT